MSAGAHMIIERADLRSRVHVFRDRAHAGAVLAEMLSPSFDRRPNAIVLAIPAGGVPVAAPIAQCLSLPLDLAVVSKVTLAWNTEVGYGAVAFDGGVYLNDKLVRAIRLSEAEVEAAVARTREKVARRNATLRQDRDYAAVTDSDVVLVDDGLASGYTLRAAVAALRAIGAATISIAVPTAHESSARTIAASVEAFYCPNVRAGHSYAVADAYRKWSEIDEKTVRAILSTVRPPAPSQ
jgi:predicted phosphoribosyltransferase